MVARMKYLFVSSIISTILAMPQTSIITFLYEYLKYVWLITVLVVLMISINYPISSTTHATPGRRGEKHVITKKICVQLDHTLRARHKTCFLRPDTGPCRADIIQWYFDVKQRKCYRFFWGGCQGNGNRFESLRSCHDYCYLNQSDMRLHIPNFCSMTFDYGTCFGHYNRWAWDSLSGHCKRRLYSGCGGNQNNFHSLEECGATCLHPPNNTLMRSNRITTCVPFNIDKFQK